MGVKIIVTISFVYQKYRFSVISWYNAFVVMTLDLTFDGLSQILDSSLNTLLPI